MLECCPERQPYARGLCKLGCAYSLGGVGARRAGHSIAFAGLTYIAKRSESMLSTLQVTHGNPLVSAQSDASPPIERIRTLTFPQEHCHRDSSTCACGKLCVRAIATNSSRASKILRLRMLCPPFLTFSGKASEEA
jgi:hypothetical protein